MLIHLGSMAVGLVLLVLGANALVRGASRLALSLGISPLVVGLTIVAFGTGAPEMAVSIDAVRASEVDIAIGNVVGSNIFNVLFILGVSALIVPLVVDAQVIRQEVPVMIAAVLLLFALAADGGISRLDGLLLVALLGMYTVFLVVQSRRATSATRDEYADGIAHRRAGWGAHWSVQLVLVAGGLVLLVVGARRLVEGAVAIALDVGVSELVVGLTIVAAGTSLPEVATSLAAALRGERDIAVGNVVGSNTFNVLGVLGVSATLAPVEIPVPASVLAFDLPVMAAVSLACLPLFVTGSRIERWEGALLVAYYAAYTGYLVLAAQRHEGLPALGDAIAWFVVPLVLVALVSSLGARGASRERTER